MAIATLELGNAQLEAPSSADDIDSSGGSVLNIGRINATAINIGHTGLSTYIYGTSLFIGSTLDTITATTLHLGGINATGISFDSPTSIIGNFTPAVDDAYSIGSSSLRWKDGYFSQQVVITAGQGISQLSQGATNTTGIVIAPNVADGANSIGLLVKNTTALPSGILMQVTSGANDRFTIADLSGLGAFYLGPKSSNDYIYGGNNSLNMRVAGTTTFSTVVGGTTISANAGAGFTIHDNTHNFDVLQFSYGSFNSANLRILDGQTGNQLGNLGFSSALLSFQGPLGGPMSIAPAADNDGSTSGKVANRWTNVYAMGISDGINASVTLNESSGTTLTYASNAIGIDSANINISLGGSGNLLMSPNKQFGVTAQAATNTTAMTISPNVVDGASSIGLYINGITSNVTAGSKLLSVANAGTEWFHIGVSSTSLREIVFNGDTDASAVGPMTLKATGAGSIGTAITLDATASTGGNKFSFISTGSGAGVGAGKFAVFMAGGGYRFIIDGVGNTLPGTNNTFTLGDVSSRWANVYSYLYSLEPGGSFSNTTQAATNTTAMTLASNVADGTSSIGLLVNNTTTLTSGGAMMVQFNNNGTKLFGFQPYSGGGGYITGDAVAPHIRLSNASGAAIGYNANEVVVDNTNINMSLGGSGNLLMTVNKQFGVNTQGATNTTAMTIAPNVVDGVSSIGLLINAVTALPSGKVITVQNGGAEVFSVVSNFTSTVHELLGANSIWGFRNVSKTGVLAQGVNNIFIYANSTAVMDMDFSATPWTFSAMSDKQMSLGTAADRYSNVWTTNLSTGSSATNTTALTITSNVADGASSVGVLINNTTTLATNGARFLSIQDGGTDQVYFSIGSIVGSYPSMVYTAAGSVAGIGLNVGNQLVMAGTGGFVPFTDNTTPLGGSGNRWSDGYFGGKIVLDGYKLDLTAGAISGQALTYNGTAFVATTISATAASAKDVQLTTTSPTTIVTFTPGTSGNYMINVYYRVITATTNVTITLTWTDGTGAQTSNLVASATPTATGSYILPPTYINSTTSAITVSVTAGTANQLFVSSTITVM